MTFVRRSLLALCLSLLVAGLVPRFSAGQATSPKPASAPAAASTATPQPASTATPAAPQQAYSLPPEKLAKAIALSRIRHIMGFAGTIWGLVVLWILLATHFFSCTAAWAERV